MNGTRLSAVRDADVLGYVEIEVFDDGERLSRRGGWADIGNLHVAEPYRRRGVATWLLGQAAGWLRLAQVGRLLDYAQLDKSGAGYPGVPDHGRLPGADQDQARLDPDAAGRAVRTGWLDPAGPGHPAQRGPGPRPAPR